MSVSKGRSGVASLSDVAHPQGTRGRKPKPIVEHPEPLTADWVDPPSFPAAFELHMRRHGDSYHHLHRAIVREGEAFDRKTLQFWAAGTKRPQTVTSFDVLSRIEHRYRLPAGYFRSKLEQSGKAIIGRNLPNVAPSERRRLAWHLPDDFEERSSKERSEILEWVRTVIISGTTEYRRFQAEALKLRYGLRFPTLEEMAAGHPAGQDSADLLTAPATLVAEIAGLVSFKTKTLTAIGEQRRGVWGEETASQKVEHLALMFGALSAGPRGDVAGLGVQIADLSMAMLVFPPLWDWYLQWREVRRGFYTTWEINMLSLIAALTRAETGWLWQNQGLAERLVPIAPLIGPADVEAARADWRGTCERMHAHALSRSKEIARVARVHRDAFEPILTVLESDSPVREYRRITTEILARMPDSGRYPLAAAEAVRGFLMLRLGLHLGVRQKNLRQLLVCPRGRLPRSERQLETLKRGEMRWNAREGGWEVLIPSNAFKNANSSFFGKKPFRLLLPDFDGLYGHIEAYLTRHRPLLLGTADDPGTFFVKTVKRSSSDAAYNQTAFYEAWRHLQSLHGQGRH